MMGMFATGIDRLASYPLRSSIFRIKHLVNFYYNVAQVGRRGRFNGFGCVFMVGMGAYFRVVRGIVVAEDELVLRILVMVSVLCFDQHHAMFYENFDKFQQGAIPKA